MGHGGHGAPPKAGDLGTAEENYIGLPALVQVEPHQPLHFAAVQRLAKGVLRLLTEHRHIGVVGHAGQIYLGWFNGRGRGAAAVGFQQPRTGPVLQGTLGSLDAGQRQRPRHGAGVGVMGLQNVERGADGIAVGLGQVRQNQLRHGQCIAVVRRQFIAHIRKPPHFKSVLIIPFVSLFVQKTAQKSPLDFG